MVVVPKNDVRMRQAREQRKQLLLAARAREQVAGDTDEVGLTLGDPADRPLDRAHSA